MRKHEPHPASTSVPHSLRPANCPPNCRLFPQFPHTIHRPDSTRREADKMQTVRNITVAVSDDIYRQTRRLAAQYDITVTDMVRYLLRCLPEAFEAALVPGGRPQFRRAAYLANKAGKPWPPPLPSETPSHTPTSGQNAATIHPQNPVCIPVNPPQTTDSKSDSTASSSQNTAPVSQYNPSNPCVLNNLPLQH
jgi:hypothetical protein